MLNHFQPYIDYKELIKLQAQEISYKVKPKEQPKIKIKERPYQPAQRRQVLKMGRK